MKPKGIPLMKYVFLIALSIFSYATATIVEHDTIESIFEYLAPDDYHPRTIVIFDIDNTVAQTEGILGSDQWFSHLVSEKIKQGMQAQQAVDHTLPLYFEIQFASSLVPVQPTTVEIIKRLQESGVIVIALTIRSLELCERTIEQLKSIGIDFSHAALGDYEIVGDEEHKYRYINGIIFCNGNDKGIILKKILNALGHNPTKIVAMDDKEKHLHAVQKSLHADIEFIGIRYSHLDEKVAQFDPIIAEQLLQQFLCRIPIIIS